MSAFESCICSDNVLLSTSRLRVVVIDWFTTIVVPLDLYNTYLMAFTILLVSLTVGMYVRSESIVGPCPSTAS
jgi:hypothetical protein